MSLSLDEQETIINFNKGESIAYIFTYEKTWQQHLEKKLKLKPLYDNGQGGREYEIDKKRIKMPRAIRKLSKEHKEKLLERLGRTRQNTILSPENPRVLGKSEHRRGK